MFTVDKGIPCPTAGIGIAKYPWATMEVGDSFFVPGDPRVLALRLQAAASKERTRTGKRYTGRRQVDGVRIWRAE